MLGCEAPDPGQVRDARVGEDQAHVRVPAARLERVPAERGDPAPGVAEHREVALVRERKDRLQVGMVQREALGARV